MANDEVVYLSGRSSNRLVVAFSCWHEEQSLYFRPTDFDFINTIITNGCDGLLLRDRSNLWYQHGICGVQGGVQGIVALIRDVAANYDEVMTLGSSMGGYAALLFGHLVGASHAVAIVPQLRVGSIAARTIGDSRSCNEWRDDFEFVDRHASDRSYLYLDQLPLSTSTRYRAYFGDQDPNDLKHIALAQQTFIQTTVIHGTNHNEAARAMLRSGALMF